MERCPKCGRYTVEYAMSMGVAKCYNWPDCKYEVRMTQEEYDRFFQVPNVLDEYRKTLELRGMI